MKKAIKRVFVFLVLISMISSSFNVSAASVKGDINGDGKVKTADARIVMKIISGISNANSSTLKKADVNNDGSVTIADVKEILAIATDVQTQNTLSAVTQLSPKDKHGSSTKYTFCQVTEYCAETLPESPVNDRSNPLYSSLPKGTIDYVKSGPVGSGDKSYYVLNSGRRVYANEVKTFTGYKMPNAKAQLRYPTLTTSKSTSLYIALDCRVPFNVTVKPQEYETGYDSRPFNIADGEFTAKYMDITFSYIKSADGSLYFPESKTIKSCKWITDTENQKATLRIYFRETGGFYGYTAYYNKDNLLVISVKEPVTKLKGRTIEIDPGHGGTQPGAGSGTGVYEKDITYKIALQLKSYLEKAGATVILSRDDSASVPEIEERRITAIKKDPDLFVSIHLDSSTAKSAHGSSVYYYKNYSGPLAYAIAQNLASTDKNEAGYNMKNRGAHFYPFMVTRIENCPAVLVECGFISNTTAITTPSDGAKSNANCDFKYLNSSVGQKYTALGIYNGIIDYFGI